jgi:hypothetical protein
MIVIEIACLWGRDGELVIKEASILAHENNITGGCSRSTTTYRFLPPYPEGELSEQVKSTNNWVKSRLHKISWNQGKVKYSQLSTTLKFAIKYYETSKIYAKGHEKSLLLTGLLGKSVIDLATLGCPKAEIMENIPMSWTTCDFPHTFEQCTLSRCLKYEAWLCRPSCEPKTCILC